MNLNPEEIVAILKVIPTKECTAARKAIENDSQTEIDLVVRVSGKLERAAKPKPSKGTSRIPWTAAIALFLKRSGATGPSTIKLLAEVICEAAAMDSGAKASLLKESGVGDALQIVDEELFSKLPPIEKNGNITFKGEVEAIRQPVEAEAVHQPIEVIDNNEQPEAAK